MSRKISVYIDIIFGTIITYDIKQSASWRADAGGEDPVGLLR